MAEITLIAHLLNQTLSPDATAVHTSTAELDRLSVAPHFPFHLLSISVGNFPNSSSSTSDSFFSIYFQLILFSILNRRWKSRSENRCCYLSQKPHAPQCW